MANHLKMAEIDAIRALHRSGMSGRAIARELEVDRETVAKYIQDFDPKPAKALTGSETLSVASPNPHDHDEPPKSNSRCEPHREQILSYWDRGLTAQRIHQELEDLLGDDAPSHHRAAGPPADAS